MTNRLAFEPRLPDPPKGASPEEIYQYLLRERVALFEELRYLRREARAVATSNAPIDAQYVTLAATADLTAERVLTAGTGISITDAGAGSTVTVAQSGTVYRPLRPNAAILATLASGPAEYVETVGSYYPVPGLKFDADTNESAYWLLKALSYGGGNLTIKILWYADTASTNSVVWAARVSAITPDTDTQDIETDAFGTAATVKDTHLGTTGQRVHTCTITVTDTDSLAKDDWLAVHIYRKADDATDDTMTGDAILVDATLSYAFG